MTVTPHSSLICRGFLLLAFAVVGGCTERTTEILPDFLFRRETVVVKLTPEELSQWELIGKGSASVDTGNNALVLREGADSKGITLVSPKSYGRRVSVSFEMQPLSYEGISFVFLSASDVVTMGELKIPEEHRGSFDFWSDGRVQNYLFAFHDGFYDAKPYIVKNPGMKDVASAKDLVEAKNSISVEVGRRGRILWTTIDDEVVVKGKDKARGGLPDGRIGFRLRGSGKGSYGCILKNVTITEEK